MPRNSSDENDVKVGAYDLANVKHITERTLAAHGALQPEVPLAGQVLNVGKRENFYVKNSTFIELRGPSELKIDSA